MIRKNLRLLTFLALSAWVITACNNNSEPEGPLPDNVFDETNGIDVRLTWNRQNNPDADLDLRMIEISSTEAILRSTEANSSLERFDVNNTIPDGEYNIELDYFRAGSNTINYTLEVRGNVSTRRYTVNSGASTPEQLGKRIIARVIKRGNRYTVNTVQ
jgi:hypothetical protein